MRRDLPIRIGTRGSTLALAQASEVKKRLLGVYPDIRDEEIEIVPIKTTGDRIQSQNLSEIGGKGLFTKEIEEALIAGTIDLAVHSMKDMPALIPDGLEVNCILPREDPHDAFLSPRYGSLEELPEKAVIGTSSSRRQAQLLAMRPDFTIIPFRGNIVTRIDKLKAGAADAIILATAGLNRINLNHEIRGVIAKDKMLPAVAQAAIGVQCRTDDQTIQNLIAPIHHAETGIAIAAERAFLTILEGNCRTPMAAFAEINGNILYLRALIATIDGETIYRTERRGPFADAVLMGNDAGFELKSKGGAAFFSHL